MTKSPLKPLLVCRPGTAESLEWDGKDGTADCVVDEPSGAIETPRTARPELAQPRPGRGVTYEYRDTRPVAVIDPPWTPDFQLHKGTGRCKARQGRASAWIRDGHPRIATGTDGMGRTRQAPARSERASRARRASWRCRCGIFALDLPGRGC